MEKIYKILEFPAVYRLSQMLLAPGRLRLIRNTMIQLLNRFPAGDSVLDIACGPRSILEQVGIHPVGVDIIESYIDQYNANGGRGHVMSADNLEFENESFTSVWSIGLIHHLSDEISDRAIKEMVRVCVNGGTVFILDAVMPRYPLSKPWAWLIRKCDRGQFVRHESEWKTIVLESFPGNWIFERRTITYTGLEAIIGVLRKETNP